MTHLAHTQLATLVARIEHLEEEKKAIAADIAEIYKEAKGNGFDVKVLRKVVVRRRKPAAERAEEEAMIDVYLSALGGPDDEPKSFTRKDGIHVTVSRARAPKEQNTTGSVASARGAAGMELAQACPVAPIPAQVPPASAPARDDAAGEGAIRHTPAASINSTGSACDADINPAPQVVPGTLPGETLHADTEQPGLYPHGAGVEAAGDPPEAPTPAATPDWDDLAIPDFLKRGKPQTQMHGVM